MKFQSALFLGALLSASIGGIDAFQPVAPALLPLRRDTTSLLMAWSHDEKRRNDNNGESDVGSNLVTRQQQQNPLWTSWFVAGAIFVSTLVGSMATTGTIMPAHAAEVELSTGAIIVQTSAKDGQSILKAEVDVKDLLGSLIKNRKALKESVGRVTTVVVEELQSPVWTEVGKEFLQFEGDVTPKVTVSPPRDIQQTIADISKGKLNLIVNGEIINLSIDKSSFEGEDELVIRAKGVRGRGLPSFNEPAVTEVRTRLQDQIDAINEFWFSPLPLPAAIQDKLPEGTVIETGNALLGGSVVAVGGIYAISYAYYISEQEEAAAKAEAQRKVVADRNKRSAEAKARNAAKDANEES
jgi:hypothetical protein